MTVDENKPKKSRIPYYFVAFFVLLAIVDGIFVYIATSTHRGVVTDHAYQKGLDYNKTIAASDKQDLLGWSGNIEFDGKFLTFSLLDESSEPINNAKVTAYLSRATQAGHDFEVSLINNGNNIYSNKIIFPLKGQWDIVVLAVFENEQYQKSKKILVE